MNNDKYIKKGFDDRIVRYEEIHKIKDDYFQVLVGAIDPKPNDVILDGMDGYGSVSRWILSQTKEKGFKPEIFTLDESATQIERARKNIPDIDEQHIIRADIRKTGFPNEKFDSIVIKMGVHEVRKQEQIKIFSEMYRILKPGGKFVIWELSLNQDTQSAFQDILRKKDELASFEAMVENRYFPRHDELQRLFEEAGFTDVKDEYEIRYVFDPKSRFEELISRDRKEMTAEKGTLSEQDEEELSRRAQERVSALIAYIRERVTDDIKDKVEYKDLGDNIEMTFDKIIMSGKK